MPFIEHLTPATEEGWWLLFELAEADPDSWALIGGQMVQVVVAAHDAGALMRPTDDIDVLVDVRVRRRGTEWLARWLLERGFELAGIGADGIGNQFVRDARAEPAGSISMCSPLKDSVSAQQCSRHARPVPSGCPAPPRR